MIEESDNFQTRLNSSIREAQSKDPLEIQIKTIIFVLVMTILLVFGTTTGVIRWKDPRLTPQKTEKPKTEQSRQQTITIKMANSVKTCSSIFLFNFLF